MADKAIVVESVSKDFALPHERAGSFKNAFVGLLRGRSGRIIEQQHALRNISFEVEVGEFFGIVGRNGSGKSTLLKILSQIYQPTKGQVRVTGRLVPFIELGVGFNPELTGRENVYLSAALMGFSTKEIAAMYDDIVRFAELKKFMDQKLKNYSSGMQVRLAFSVAIRVESDILILDEVLAVGDADFQRKCYNYFKSLKKMGKTVVLVTHDMNAVRQYCSRAMLIEKSKVVKIGTPNAVADAYLDLFQAQQKDDLSQSDRRGNKTMEVVSTQLERSLSEISILMKLRANQVITDPPLFGFKLSDATGQALMGTNNQILRQTMGSLKQGQLVTVVWSFANVLSQGMYSIDISVLDRDGVTVFDHWPQAIDFEVVKKNTTPYPFTPDIRLVIE